MPTLAPALWPRSMVRGPALAPAQMPGYRQPLASLSVTAGKTRSSQPAPAPLQMTPARPTPAREHSLLPATPRRPRRPSTPTHTPQTPAAVRVCPACTGAAGCMHFSFLGAPLPLCWCRLVGGSPAALHRSAGCIVGAAQAGPRLPAGQWPAPGPAAPPCRPPAGRLCGPRHVRDPGQQRPLCQCNERCGWALQLLRRRRQRQGKLLHCRPAGAPCCRCKPLTGRCHRHACLMERAGVPTP